MPRLRYISYDSLRGTADEFLGRHHSTARPPIPIDEIVQCDFGTDIIPVYGFEDWLGVVACANRSFSKIYVDRYVLEHNDPRYRFSIAHELGHFLLHREFMEHIRFETLDEWKQAVSSIDKKDYLRLEHQANYFAGVVLVPTTMLHKEFELAKQEADLFGMSFDSDPDVAITEIMGSLVDTFQVSLKVMEIRLGFEELWPK